MSVADRFARAYRDSVAGIRWTMAFATPQAYAEGDIWYDTMGEWAHANGRPEWSRRTACGVFSAFSPRCTVAQNQARYLAFARTGTAPGLTEHLATARRIVADGIDALTGRKRIDFSDALYGIVTAVVVDTHGCKISGIRSDAPTKVQYDAIVQAHRDIAPEYGLTPRALQAVSWVTERGSAW